MLRVDWRMAALVRVSCHSCSGIESAMMPAPVW